MSFTYEVNEDNSVTILNDGYVFSVQTDDPDVEGYEVFESAARASEWAEAAIVRYAAELAAQAAALEAANAAAEAEREREAVVMGDPVSAVEAPTEE